MSRFQFERIKQRLWLKVISSIQYGRIVKYRFISSLKIKGNIIRYQPVHAVGSGILEIEGNVKIGVFPSPYFFSSYAYIESRNPWAKISIGDGTWINNGVVIIAEHSSIKIGRRCLLGTNVEVIDSDFHGLEVRDRNRSISSWCRPVIIEDDVFLGSNVKIQKGVTIGRSAVVANGSVVTKDVPPCTVVGGNPIRNIRSLEPLD